MANPFPGMNPYLEDSARWAGVHHSLMTYIRDELQVQLSPNYVAVLEERVYVDTSQARVPDVFVIERVARERQAQYLATTPAGNLVAALSEPLFIDAPPLEVREAFVTIRHSADERIVTWIEVLSPTNKAHGKGRHQYLTKQNELLATDVNLVEVDLLAYGLPTLAVVRGGHSVLPPYRYLVSVRRMPYRFLFETYPVRLEQKLPFIRVPLVAPDPDVTLDIQAVLNQTYDNGAYHRLLNYREPPRTTLSTDEVVWVDELLRAQNLR
ncbi:MAG: DUF4058 family protein [Anaerolineales bacterium]|nr:DUF4058 family protein [Anaerolineales bacterium]